ncbi:MAG: hypothetical protein ABI778_05250 [Ignavibacteriota bacterium]
MRRSYTIAFLILVTALGGCDPYRFRNETKYPVECRIFSDHNSVSSNLYGFTMHPEATVQVTSVAWTQFEFRAYMTLSGGEGFSLMLRPVLEEGVIDPGLVLTFSTANGLSLDSAGHELLKNSAFHFPEDKQTFVTIYNEESYIEVTIGCDTILKRFTKRKSSDDIGIHTLGGTELSVISPEWQKIKFRKEFELLEEQVR